VSRRVKIILVSLLGVTGLLLLIGTLASAQSPRAYISKHYRRVGNDGGAQVYASSKPATQTASDIAHAAHPADRRATESGVFLRYRSDFVAVVPQAGGGSRVEVSDERSGYTHFYPYIGGYWGTYSGPAEHFRGGGPGVGK